MQEAVDLAEKNTKKPGTILLSPAAPSYNLYKNFEERGNDFKEKIFHTKCLNHLEKQIVQKENKQKIK